MKVWRGPLKMGVSRGPATLTFSAPLKDHRKEVATRMQPMKHKPISKPQKGRDPKLARGANLPAPVLVIEVRVRQPHWTERLVKK
jgi:hypothetical protein